MLGGIFFIDVGDFTCLAGERVKYENSQCERVGSPVGSIWLFLKASMPVMSLDFPTYSMDVFNIHVHCRSLYTKCDVGGVTVLMYFREDRLHLAALHATLHLLVVLTHFLRHSCSL